MGPKVGFFPTENRVEMRMRKQEHSPTRALHSGFLHEAFRPSVEINGMQSPELKNVRFPHEILDPVFHGDKSFRVRGANKTFLLGGKNMILLSLFPALKEKYQSVENPFSSSSLI